MDRTLRPYDGILSPEPSSFEDRLAAVESRLQRVLERTGRTRSEITLVAVSKKFSAASLQGAYQAGLRHFGENYVQEFADKKPALSGLTEARFHLIGHLQSNKAKIAAELFDCVQTVDSPKLLERLNAAAESLDRTLDAMLEVKLGDEESKTGAAPDDIPALLAAAARCEALRLRGLMTIPPWSEDAELSRPYFRQLCLLARTHGLPDISMGMSNDFEVAIEEGATIVRVGTALFGARPKPAAQ